MNQFKNLDIRIAKNLIGDIDYVDNDFIVLDDLSKFKIPNDSPIRLGAFTISLCLNGHITTDINMIRYDVQPGDMVITLPKDIIEHKDVSSDIRGIFFIVSQRFIEEAFPKIGEILPIFLYIQKYPKIELTANQCFNIQQFYDFFIQRLKDQSVYRDKMISSILQALIYYITGLLINSDKREKKERKEELLSKFIQLIIKHYKENRTLDFYAEKLFISTKYMSDIIKKTSGLTAHDWIDRYTILEAKILLRSTNKTIPSNPQPIGFSGILLAKRQNSFYCTYFLHNRNVADTKSPYPIKRLEVIRWFNQKSMVFNQSLS